MAHLAVGRGSGGGIRAVSLPSAAASLSPTLATIGCKRRDALYARLRASAPPCPDGLCSSNVLTRHSSW